MPTRFSTRCVAHWPTTSTRRRRCGLSIAGPRRSSEARDVTRRRLLPSPTSWPDMRLGILLNLGLSALFLPFAAVCAAVVYHDLRRAHDGVDVEELIRVFQ